jgi:hypothetical protein
MIATFTKRMHHDKELIGCFDLIDWLIVFVDHLIILLLNQSYASPTPEFISTIIPFIMAWACMVHVCLDKCNKKTVADVVKHLQR